MGSRQPNAKTVTKITKNEDHEKSTQNQHTLNENGNLIEDFQCEEDLNIQFIERRDFKQSTQLIASKNLLQNSNVQRSITFKYLQDLKNGNEVQKAFDVLMLPLTSNIFRTIKNYPQFQIVKIDFKKFITTKSTPITDDYTFLQQVGNGSFGIVYRAELKAHPDEFRAIKKIEKKSINTVSTSQLSNQFTILKKCDHPNILKLFEIYEDKSCYYVVSQYCQGGTLLQYINYHEISSCDIKTIMVQTLSALKYIHNLRILHRDIKLQNLLIIKDKNKSIQIKLIDFGLSVDLTTIKSSHINQMAGTLVYMAPQALYGELNIKSDIWSCGIMLYVLMTKRMPYKFNNQEDLMNKIDQCRIIRKHMKILTMKVKNLINLMLQKDTNRRYSADRALQNDWLKEGKKSSLTITQKRRAATQIFSYNVKNNLISMIQSYIAVKKINQSQRQRLAILFSQIDKDKSGVIDVRELKSFYQQNSEYYNEGQIEDLIKALDKNKSGFIDFTEFIIATHNKRQFFLTQNLKEVFDYFDADRSGNISKKEIQSALQGIKNEEIDFLFNKLDEDSNDQISKNQFFKYFHTNQF